MRSLQTRSEHTKTFSPPFIYKFIRQNKKISYSIDGVLFCSSLKTESNPSVPARHIHQLLHQPQSLHMLSFDKTCNLIHSSASLSHNISLEDTSYVTEEGRGESEAWLMGELVSQQWPCWPLFTCLSHQRPNTATFQSTISLGHLSAKSCLFPSFSPLYLHRHEILLPVFSGKKRKFF